MTSRPASSNRPTTLRRRRGPLLPTVIIVVVLVIGFVFFANVYTEVLWYNQLGYLEVFWRQNSSQVLIFALGFLIMAGAVYASIRVAYRARPVYAPDSQLQDNLNRYQAQLEPIRRVVMIGVPIVFGLFGGSAAAGAVAEGPAVLLPGTVRPEGPAVRPGHQFLHQHAAVPGLRLRVS